MNIFQARAHTHTQTTLHQDICYDVMSKRMWNAVVETTSSQ